MAAATRPRDAVGRFVKRAEKFISEGQAQRASALGWVSRAPGSDTTHRGASATDEAMAAWWPGNSDVNADHARESRDLVDRTRDLVLNNPSAQAAVDRRVSMTVGTKLRWSSRHELMAKRLGITTEAASLLASQIEAAWEESAYDPLHRFDWEGHQNVGGQLNLMERHHTIDGEALGVMRWEEDVGKLPYGWRWRSSLQVIDPDRLSNPNGRMNGPLLGGNLLTNGIETDGRRIVAYHIRDAHPADPSALGQQLQWTRVPAATEWGRPVVIHLRTKKRAGQQRGLSRFVAVLKTFKQLEKYTEAELSSAALNALSGHYIKTTKPAGEAGEALGFAQLQELGKLRKDFYEAVDPRLSNGARVAVLAPGDDLEINAVARHVASFQGFIQTSGRLIAAALGITGSDFLGDFTGMSFSTWRGEMLAVWRDVLEGRDIVETQAANKILLCVIEEGIENGAITPPSGCPGLYENTSGWLAGRWIGPTRGTISPVDDIKAGVEAVSAGLSTHEDEALNWNGSDYAANVGQIAHERDVWKETGLATTAIQNLEGAPKPGAAAAPSPPQPENAGSGDVVEPAPQSASE